MRNADDETPRRRTSANAQQAHTSLLSDKGGTASKTFSGAQACAGRDVAGAQAPAQLMLKPEATAPMPPLAAQTTAVSELDEKLVPPLVAQTSVSKLTEKISGLEVLICLKKKAELVASDNNDTNLAAEIAEKVETLKTALCRLEAELEEAVLN